MLYDRSTDTVIGALGWVDHGSLWTFDVGRRTERLIAVEGAEYLGLKAGQDGLFRVTHNGSPDDSVSIRHGSQPDVELTRVRLGQGGPRFTGDVRLWGRVDPSVVLQTASGPRLVWIDAAAGTTVDLDLSWFTGDVYDLGYQGIVESLTLPELRLVVVAVQRSSELVLIDLDRNARAGSIALADRGGNPSLTLLGGGGFLASDYDTLCLVDPRTRTVRKSAVLQPTAEPNTQQFIGEYDAGERGCVVGRPFSGDVLLLDIETFAVRDSVRVGGQPLAVCVTSGSGFVTRDWQTGKPKVGRFAG